MKTKRMRESYVVRFFRFLTQFVYEALGAGALGRFFAAYHTSDGLFHRSRAGRFFERIERGGGRAYCLMRRNIALAIENSLLRRGVWHLVEVLLLSSLRTIGVFFLTAGTYSIIVYGLFLFVWNIDIVGAIQFYAGCAAVLMGIFLLFFDHSVGFVLRKSIFFRKIFVPLFGASEESLKDIPRVGRQSVYIAVPLGMLIGALSALTSPLYIIVGAVAAFVILSVLATPESGVLLLLLLLPFFGFLPNGTAWLVAAIALPMVAYLLKLLRGNRAFHMDVQDFVVLLLLLFTVLSGVSVAGRSAWYGALISALAISAYFFVVNVIATPRWLNRCRTALIISATVSALIGIVQFVLAAIEQLGDVPLSTLGETVCAGFVDRTTFAYYLIIAFPFALFAFLRGEKQHRLLSGLALVAILIATVLTWVQSAWIALAVMIVVFALIHERRFFPFILTLCLLTPTVYAFLPVRARSFILQLMRSNSSATFAKSVYAGEVASRIFFGSGEGLYSKQQGLLRLLFGLGNGGFEQICQIYVSTAPADTAASLNFWLYRLLEGGILGVLLPALLLFFMLQNCFSLLRMGASTKKLMSPTVGVAMVVGVLVHGIFRYAWYDYTALTVFFVAAALIGADARYQRRQREVDCAEKKSDGFSAQLDYYA